MSCYLIDTFESCCIFGLSEIFFVDKIKKRYTELMRQADIAVGRKEVVKLLKKAAKIRSILDENLAA